MYGQVPSTTVWPLVNIKKIAVRECLEQHSDVTVYRTDVKRYLEKKYKINPFGYFLSEIDETKFDFHRLTRESSIYIQVGVQRSTQN